MIYQLKESICDCGSTEVSQQAQRYSVDGNWTTKKDRELNLEIKISDITPCIFMGDPTWYICANCEKDLEADVIRNKINLLFKNRK